MSKSSSTKSYGLRLTLPGAPEGTPFTVAGITGVYRTDEVTPVGGPDEPTLDQAREIAEGEDAPVKLEEVGPRKVEQLRDEQPTTITDVAGDGPEGGQ